jgi:flagellar hook-length control protein FliK
VNLSAVPAAAVAQAATAQAIRPDDAGMAGDDFGEQLLQLLMAGDATLAGADTGESPKRLEESSEAASDDDESPMSLLPGLSLLIQTLANADAALETSAEAPNAASAPIAVANGGTGVLADLLEQNQLEQLSAVTDANDASTTSTLDVAALTQPPQTQQTMPPPASNASTAASMPTPLDAAHAERFAESLDERITWLADAARNSGPQQATISLHPAEWGSLQIRVDLAQDGRTTVKFDCETPQARQAIEASLTQLRELLSTTAVSGAAPRFELSGGFGHQQSGAWKPATPTTVMPDEGEPVERLSIARRPLGLLDQFA